ncbi:MAG: hypothetical protein IT294_06395 [Deltaproteobacteria bacterium]|nr:hypothetical protein [Deltaproteobacteria bacterium]
MSRRLALQLLVLTVVADSASAGVVIVGTYTGAKTPKGRTVEFRIQDGRGRIASQPGQFIYYDHAKRTAYIVDMEKKTSFAVDEARAKQISAQLDQAQKTMEAKLKELPPERRAMVEKMMKEQGGSRSASPRKPLDFLKVSDDRIGAWPCARYRASGDGRKVEVCTAEADALNIPPDDVAVFEGFLDLSERMAGVPGPGSAAGGAAERGYEGLPLERQELRDGVVTDRFVIDSITTESMAADELHPPSGLKEVTPPGFPAAR